MRRLAIYSTALLLVVLGSAETQAQFTVTNHVSQSAPCDCSDCGNDRADSSSCDCSSPFTVNVNESKYQVTNHCMANRQELVYTAPQTRTQTRTYVQPTVREVQHNPFPQEAYRQGSLQGTTIRTTNAITAVDPFTRSRGSYQTGNIGMYAPVGIRGFTRGCSTSG